MSTLFYVLCIVLAGLQQQDQGKSVFMGKGNCLTCHGANAKGTPLAPNLTDSTWLHVDGSETQIVALIRTGVAKPKQHPAPMPPMGGAKLTDAEIAAVAKYVVGLGPRSTVQKKD